MPYSPGRASVIQFEHMALAGAVQGSLEHSMLTGELGPAQEEMVSEVVLLAPNSVITASSEVSEIGEITDADEVRSLSMSQKKWDILFLKFRAAILESSLGGSLFARHVRQSQLLSDSKWLQQYRICDQVGLLLTIFYRQEMK